MRYCGASLGLLIMCWLVAGAPVAESAGSVYSGAVLADNPFAYYRFNEAGGPTAANIGLVGSALDATYHQASNFSFQQPSLLPSGDDFSVRTDASGAEIRIPDHERLNTAASGYDNKTVELWFQVDPITSHFEPQVLYEQGGITRGISLYVEKVSGNDRLYMGAWNEAESDWGPSFVTATIHPDTPYHAVLVLDGDPDGNDGTDDGVVRGYLNGTSLGAGSGAGNLRAHGDDAAAMGIHQNARGSGWTRPDGYNLGGFVDELALYNTKLDDPNGDGNLSDGRVAAHYDAGSALTLGFVSADFALRRIRDVTASEIDWTTRGVLDPGDLTAVDERPAGALAGLFDTADAQGHFAPDKNIGDEGPWSVSIPLSLTADSVSLEHVVLDWQHFNNSGGFQTADRFADWAVSVIGSESGLLDTVTMANVGGTSGLLTLSFPIPLNLTRAETYDLKIYVDGSNADGNNTGLDGVTLYGAVVIPEPTTLLVWSLLAGLGIGLGWRRRK